MLTWNCEFVQGQLLKITWQLTHPVFPALLLLLVLFIHVVFPVSEAPHREVTYTNKLTQYMYVFHVYDYQMLIFGKERNGKLFTCDANQTKKNIIAFFNQYF